jgi:hypothetical protein
MSASAITQHADRVHAAIESDEAAKSALVASWTRSAALHHLDPAERRPPSRLTGRELDLARRRIEPLVRASQASLDRLYLAVGGIGCQRDRHVPRRRPRADHSPRPAFPCQEHAAFLHHRADLRP